MRLDLKHGLDTDPATFWDRLFFEKEFNHQIYRVGLRFPEWQLLDTQDLPTERLQTVRVVPSQDAPAAIKKLAPGTFSYVEQGRFDKAAQCYTMQIVPSVLENKIRIEGQIRAGPVPGEPKRMLRLAQFTVEVKLFGLGGMVESFLARSIEENLTGSVPWVNRYIAEHQL